MVLLWESIAYYCDFKDGIFLLRALIAQNIIAISGGPYNPFIDHAS